MDEASKLISGLSNHAGIVVAPKYQNNIKHIEFIRLNQTQVMSIIASTNGQIENRIIEDKGTYSENTLREISNFLNSKYINKSIEEIKTTIKVDIKNSKGRLETFI